MTCLDSIVSRDCTYLATAWLPGSLLPNAVTVRPKVSLVNTTDHKSRQEMSQHSKPTVTCKEKHKEPARGRGMQPENGESLLQAGFRNQKSVEPGIFQLYWLCVPELRF